MADFGFWALAHENPGNLALVGPDGTEYTAGELLGRANQVVHGLRGLGLRARGRRRHPPPQRRRDVRDLPGRPAGRLVPGSHQPPPGRARDRLHREGLRGQGLHRPRALRRRGPRRRRGGRAALVAVLRRGRDPRLRLLRQHARRPADHRSAGPDHRRRHELHLGDHRQPQGGVPAS